MEIIAPLHIMPDQKEIFLGGERHWVTSAVLGISLESGRALLSTDFIPRAIGELDENSLPDAGMPKPMGEFLVSGSFYSDAGVSIEAGKVEASVGQQKKTVYVFGERHWQKGVPSKPVPFEKCELSYTHSFGGADFPPNPVGTGHKHTLLPRLEHPERLMGSSGDTPMPCSLGPQSPTWSGRSQYEGTYNDRYLERYYPGFPENLDLRYFMVGASDQWSPGYYVGNETVSLSNLHPTKPLIDTRLPNLKIRAFYRENTSLELKELPLNLDTIWLFPGEDLVLLYWRGGLPVPESEQFDQGQIVFGFESIDTPPKEISHYRSAVEYFSEGKPDSLKSFSSTRLIPKGYRSALTQMLLASKSSDQTSPLTENMKAKVNTVRATVEEQLTLLKSALGSQTSQDQSELVAPEIDGNINEIESLLEKAVQGKEDAVGSDLLAQIESTLPGITSETVDVDWDDIDFSFVDKLVAIVDDEMEHQKDRVNSEVDSAMHSLESSLQADELTSDLVNSDIQENVNPMLELLAARKDQVVTPLPRVAVDTIKDSLKQFQDSVGAGLSESKSSSIGNDAAPELPDSLLSILENSFTNSESIEASSLAFRSMYLEVAHYQPEGASPHADSHDVVKERLELKLKAGESIAGMDLACLDLSGMDFSGVDFTDCLMEQTLLNEANLTGACLRRANLARAQLDNAILIDVLAENANLGSVSATGCNLAGANLNSAILSKGNFSSASFKSANLVSAKVMNWSINKADFSGAVLSSMVFNESAVRNVVFTDADFTGSNFIGCEFHGCDFSKALLDRSIWASCQLSNCKFIEASMASASFVSRDVTLSLVSVDFSMAKLMGANFQFMTMSEVSFKGASLERANFLGASMAGCEFNNATAPYVVFRDADLSRADFNSANCIQALFSGADLTGANLSNCNCYGSDFLNTKFGETRFNGGNFDRSLLEKWQPS